MKFAQCHQGQSRSVLWLLLAALILCTASCAPKPLDRARLVATTRDYNVVIVLLDAAEAGHFSFLGYERDTTPHLKALASEAAVFENAYAQASATPLSVLSIFTSRYPLLEHAPQILGEIGPVLPQDIPSLGSLTAERFVHRLGMSANLWVSRDFGYGPGFTEFLEVFGDKPGKASRISDLFTAWIDKHHREQFLAYLHYIEPHAPYTPPPPHENLFDPQAKGHVYGTDEFLDSCEENAPPDSIQRQVVALYDGNLSYADEQVQRVVQALKAKGIWDRTIFVLISDHGEAFWQHGVRGHGRHSYEEFIRVPLLVRIPDLRDRGRRIKTSVELIDVLPTILELADISGDWAELQGRSLMNLMLDGDPPEIPPARIFSRNHELGELELAMRVGNYKMIQIPVKKQIMLFDLASDPMEQRNLFLPDGQGSRAWWIADNMAIELEKWIFATRASWRIMVAAPDTLDAETIQRLRSLGYLD